MRAPSPNETVYDPLTQKQKPKKVEVELCEAGQAWRTCEKKFGRIPGISIDIAFQPIEGSILDEWHIKRNVLVCFFFKIF